MMKTRGLPRRVVLRWAGSVALGAPLVHSHSLAAEPYNDAAAAEVWLKPWLTAPGAVSGALHLGRFADRMYFTLKPITWKPNPGQDAPPSVVVPAGFVTDLASIPRIFWSLLPTDGNYTFPAIVHDYLYWTQTTSREVADRVFKYGMEDFNINNTTITAIYQAVRLGGEGAWGDNRALRAAGEKRTLAKFPTDPRTTWPEWKKSPGVFR